MTSMEQDKNELFSYIRKRYQSIEGEQLTDQEIIRKCIEFVKTHLDEFMNETMKTQRLTPELKKKILSSTQDCELYYEDVSDDDLVYGI